MLPLSCQKVIMQFSRIAQPCRRKGFPVLFELKPEQKLATLNVLQIHNQVVGPYLLCNSKTVKKERIHNFCT